MGMRRKATVAPAGPESAAAAGSDGTTGIDRTLIDEMLRLTPEERLRYHDSVVRCILELRGALGVETDGISA